MKNVFISRKLPPSSPILKLDGKRVNIIHTSLIEITPVNFGGHITEDWLFFYSKNGIINFFENIGSSELEALKDKQFGVMGTASNQKLKSYIGRDADFVCQEDIKIEIKRFWNLVDNKRVLFIKGRTSKSTFEIEDKLDQYRELVVYTNTPIKSFEIPHCEILIFTSPMNAATYCNKYEIDELQKVLVIGESTKEEIEKFYKGKVEVISFNDFDNLVCEYLRVNT